MYDPALPEFSTLKQMTPGQGYLISMNQDATLTYPVSGRAEVLTLNGVKGKELEQRSRGAEVLSGAKELEQGSGRAEGLGCTVRPTPYATLVYGSVRVNGEAALAGTRVEVLTPQGEVAGCFTTVLNLYDVDALTLLTSNDDAGGGPTSELVWTAPYTGIFFFVEVVSAPGGITGCSATYELTIATIPGDLIADCRVDVADIQAVAGRWRLSAATPDPDGDPITPNYKTRFDLDRDGDVDMDIVDVMRVAAQWGSTCEFGIHKDHRVSGQFGEPHRGYSTSRCQCRRSNSRDSIISSSQAGLSKDPFPERVRAW